MYHNEIIIAYVGRTKLALDNALLHEESLLRHCCCLFRAMFIQLTYEQFDHVKHRTVRLYLEEGGTMFLRKDCNHLSHCTVP
jgi:hypothetical protein